VAQGDLKLVFTQIAGIIARRIVCWKKVGDAVSKGELIGLIRFGSRVDVLLPAGAEATVESGMRVRGGSSAIGIIKSDHD
jgi:phosphatidylserine decarboxylase